MATNRRSFQGSAGVAGRYAVRRRWSAWKMALLLLLLPAVVVLLPTCLVLAPLMLPTAVAFYVDRSREKWLALTVGPLNLCGAMFPIAELWGRGHGFAAAFEVLGDPYGWLIAFLGAAAGWGLYLGMPVLVARIAAARQRSRLAQIRAEQDALIEDWGPAVAQDSEPAAKEPAAEVAAEAAN